MWREKYREGALRELVMSDVHSPSRFRVAQKADPDAQVGLTVASFDAPYLNQAIRAMAKGDFEKAKEELDKLAKEVSTKGAPAGDK